MTTRYPMVPLGEALERVERSSPVEATRLYPMLGVRSFGVGAFAAPDLAGTETSYAKLLQVGTDDIVYPKLMAWEGAFARVPSELSGRFVSSEFCTFEPKAGVDPRFVEYALRTPWIADHVAGASGGTNVRRRRLYPDEFLQRTIPLPDIEEQRLVAAHLDRVALRANALQDLHRVAGEQSKAATQAAALRLDLSESERIEAGWELLPMSEILAPDVALVAVASQPSFRLAGVLSFGRGAFLRGELLQSGTKYKQLHRLRTGQVVMSRLKAWEGAIAVVPEDLDGAVASTEFPTFTIRPDRAAPEFVNALVRSQTFWSLLAGGSKGVGARRERVSAERLLSTKVWVPPIEEQVALARRLRAIWAVERRTAGRAAVVAALLPSALNRALAGVSSP